MKVNKSEYRAFALVSQFSMSILIPLIICTLLGSFLEEKYKIPVALPCIILGMLAGGRNASILSKHIRDDMGGQTEKKDAAEST